MYFYIKLVSIIILLLLSGFFSSSETAFFSLSKVRLHRRKIRKGSRFKYIINLLKAPSTFLTTVLIGNEIVNICISVVAAALVYSLTKDIISNQFLPFFSMAVTVPVLLLFGEIIPKTIAVKFPEKIACFNSYPLYLFSRAIVPLRHVLNSAAKVFIRLFVKDPTKQPLDSATIDEGIFKSMVDIGSKEGTIEPGERDLIHKAFHLDDISISDIMIPRDRIAAVPQDISEESLMEIIETKKFSRYPVFKKSIDHITGFVHAKDLLRLKGSASRKKFPTIKSILRKPTFISEGRNALSVLIQFQKNKSHIGIVTNSHGKTVGMVTLEDILEELFGEIMDETDREGKNNA
ncbi:MAG: HlyC/CorC family transporter [Deltaproteobacteria bacterium]|nr:HlyC/CorC family transporter [Deltaproteobacteria bacterium]MBW2332271.1 HlyC/CorC family transporter [Deltaproteobacteria bacterium]MCD6265568.1 HlyC/CorC family transporter [Deltaproteobacteria bacterium]HDH86893.1 HlyC/CorC family transporter [Desulfobacteraceae bacterium]